MGYKERYEATRKAAYDNYMKTIKEIEGDTNNIGSITLNWNAKKNKWDGDNETTDYQENIPKEPTKADGNLVKEKLYLVVYNDGTDDGKWGVTKNLPAALKNPNVSIKNSSNGVALEISGMRRGNIYQRENYGGQWTKLVSRYLDDDRGGASKAYRGYTSRQGNKSWYGAKELIDSGLISGFRGRG